MSCNWASSIPRLRSMRIACIVWAQELITEHTCSLTDILLVIATPRIFKEDSRVMSEIHRGLIWSIGSWHCNSTQNIPIPSLQSIYSSIQSKFVLNVVHKERCYLQWDHVINRKKLSYCRQAKCAPFFVTFAVMSARMPTVYTGIMEL